MEQDSLMCVLFEYNAVLEPALKTTCHEDCLLMTNDLNSSHPEEWRRYFVLQETGTSEDYKLKQ